MSAAAAGYAVLFWVLCGVFAIPLFIICASYKSSLQRKAGQIEEQLGSEKLKRYLKAYADTKRVAAGKTGLQILFAWDAYRPPLLLLGIVYLVGGAVTVVRLGAPVAATWQGLADTAQRVPLTAIYAFLGAYFSGLYELVRRTRSDNLSVAALHEIWIRTVLITILSPVLVPLVASPLKVPYGEPSVAFGLGALPLRDFWAWLTSHNALQVPRVGREESDTLYLVSGYRDGLRDSLADQGIESIEQLALADPITLLLRTNLQWNVILDLIDQALFINYIGEKITFTRTLGVRCAVEVATLYSRQLGGDPSEQQAVTAVIDKLAAVLEVPQGVIENIAYQLYYDPLVQFIWDNWTNAAGTPITESSPTGALALSPPRSAAEPSVPSTISSSLVPPKA